MTSLIEKALEYIKQKGQTFSFYEIRKDLKLTGGQLEIIKLQLLQLGYIKEIIHHEGEDELNPIICRTCTEGNSCDKRDLLSIKMYQLTSKALDFDS
ncbi:MAG: hypothetical protein ACXAC6_15705 [Candidatus Hodarchaeales archaeon]|jgi:hypothetical protein